MAILFTLEALVLSACTLDSGPGRSLDDDPRSRSSAADRPAQSSSEPTDPGRSLVALPTQPELSGGASFLTGALGFGAVEGGCGFLETAAGKRYEVIYPKGWRLDSATSHLRGPDGQDIGPGAIVSVRGSIATDIASICQVGPMFRAIEVISAGD